MSFFSSSFIKPVTFKIVSVTAVVLPGVNEPEVGVTAVVLVGVFVSGATDTSFWQDDNQAADTITRR